MVPVYCSTEDRNSAMKFLTIVLLASFSIAINSSMVTSYLVDIAIGLDMSVSQSSWILIAFLVGMVSMMVVIGKMAEYGKIKPAFIIGTLIYIVTLVICYLSKTMWQMVAACFFQGIGAAVLALASPILIVVFLPDDKKGMGMGVMSAMAGLGFIAGPLVGGAITNSFAWNNLFLAILPSSIMALIFGILWIPKANEKVDKHIDILNAVLLCIAIGGLLFFLQCILSDSVSIFLKVGILLLSAAAGTVLVLREKNRTSGRLINYSAVRNKNLVFILASILLASSVTAGAQYIVPYYLRGPMGLDTMQAGMVLSVSYIFTFVTSLLVGRWCDRKGCRAATVAANAVRLLFCILTAVLAFDCPLASMVLIVAILGLSCGIAGTSQNTRLVHHTEKADQADVSTMGVMATYFGSSLGMVLYNLVIAITIPNAGGSIAPMDMELISECLRNTSMFGGILCIIAMMLMMAVPNIIPKTNTN